MVSRYFPSGLYLWQIIIAVVLVFLPCSTGKPNFHPVTSCTDIKLKDIPVDVLQGCTKNMSTIHCLPDESNNLGLSCFQVTWISKGKCPSYNSYQGNMDEKDCSTVYNGTCPSALFQSPLSLKYTGCYINELKPVPTTTTPTTPLMTTMTTKTPVTSKNLSSDPTANVPITAGNRTEPDQTGVVEGGKEWKIAFIIILVFAFALIAANCVCCIFVYRYKRKVCEKCKQTIREAFFQDLPAICDSRRPQNAESRQQDSHDGPDTPMVKIGYSKRNGSLHSK